MGSIKGDLFVTVPPYFFVKKQSGYLLVLFRVQVAGFIHFVFNITIF